MKRLTEPLLRKIASQGGVIATEPDVEQMAGEVLALRSELAALRDREPYKWLVRVYGKNSRNKHRVVHVDEWTDPECAEDARMYARAYRKEGRRAVVAAVYRAPKVKR